MDLPVYFAFKGQVGGLQAELEKGADVIHGEVGSVWKRWVIHIFSFMCYLLHSTRLCPIVTFVLSPPPPFLFYLGYVRYLGKLARYLT